MNSSKFVKGALQLLLAEGLFIPTGFVTAVFLARQLAPANYGLFALISLLVVWVENLLVSGLESTTIKFISESKHKTPFVNTTYLVYVAAGILIAALMLWIAPGLSRLIQSPETTSLLQLLCLDIPIFAMAHASRHIATACKQFHLAAFMRSTYFLARLLFILLFVSFGLSIQGAIWGLIAASLAEAILGLILIRPNFIHGGFKKFKQFWNYLAPLQIAEINKKLLFHELILLKALGGSEIMTGCYGAAKNLAMLPHMLIRVIRPTLLSTLNTCLQTSRESEAKMLAVNSLRFIFWFLPFTIMLTRASKEISLLIFGKSYISAAPIFSMLLLAGIGFMFINTAGVIFTAWNKPQINVWITWPLVPLVILTLLFTYSYWGALSIAFAILLAVTICSMISIAILYTKLRIYAPLPTTIKSIMISIIIYGMTHYWTTSGWMILIKLSILSLIIASFFIFFKEFSTQERVFMFQLFSKKSF